MNKMDLNQKLLTEISKLTRDIESNYPELYKYLDESPMTIPDNPNPNIDNKTLENYLESLKSMLDKYKKEH